MTAYILAFLLYVLQSSPYVVMGWMSHRGKPLELLAAVMICSAIILGASLFCRALVTTLRRRREPQQAGIAPLSGLLLHSAVSATTWIMLFHVISAVGPVLTVSLTLVSTILTIPLGMMLLKTTKHSADTGTVAVQAIGLLLLAAVQIVKARAGVSPIEASALTTPGTLLVMLAWTMLSALGQILKVRITDVDEAAARGRRALPTGTAILAELFVTAGLSVAILSMADGVQPIARFFNWSPWPAAWGTDALWIIYLAAVPTAIGLVAQTLFANKVGTPASAALSQARPLIADVMQAMAGASAFSLLVATDMFTAAVLGGIAARLMKAK